MRRRRTKKAGQRWKNALISVLARLVWCRVWIWRASSEQCAEWDGSVNCAVL